VQEIVVDGTGCSDTNNTTVIIGSYPLASFSVNGACTGQPLALVNSSTDTVGAFALWTWTLSGLSSQTFTDSLPSIVLNTPGAYTLQLSTVSAEGCASNTTSGGFTVSATPQVSFLGDSVCAGSPLTLTGINGNNTPIRQWYWELGGAPFASTQSIQHVFPTADTITALLWAVSAQGCISDTFSQPIEVQATHAFAGDDTAVALGYPIQLQASGGTSYTWSPPEYLSNPDIADPIAILPEDTRYTVTAYSTAGCPSTASIFIKVYKGPAIYVPSAFTPNGDGANDVLKIVAPGIRQLSYLRIFDRWGAEVFHTTSLDATWDGTVSGHPVPSGVYVWMIQGIDLQGAALTQRGTVLLIR
jgi:gliding motility-associated-like protein